MSSKLTHSQLEARAVEQVSKRVVDILKWLVPHTRTKVLLRVIEEFENESSVASKTAFEGSSSQKAS